MKSHTKSNEEINKRGGLEIQYQGKNTNQKGSKFVRPETNINFDSTSTKSDKKIMSYQIYYPEAKVIAYEHSNRKGFAIVSGHEGNLTTRAKDNQLSCIKLPANRSITLYESKDFSGKRITLTNNTEKLKFYNCIKFNTKQFCKNKCKKFKTSLTAVRAREQVDYLLKYVLQKILKEAISHRKDNKPFKLEFYDNRGLSALDEFDFHKEALIHEFGHVVDYNLLDVISYSS
ncbi:hypothetical protein [Enterococcus mundtii]|uniref:Uncharacterized protein n=1 Tax=Enterococcus mundtii TaxID=53346 RepID=A0A242KUJ6_ENTMU|nr:hypothetical protein [Enterococcus mundtii]OTP19982.1 hypothetical protein A5802_003210 [Enterococcus mundtii]OTP24819.1 hypothetical protein A5802_002974 [Enterococcus mundtii]